MKSDIDIENARSKEVTTISLNVIKLDDREIIMDLSNINGKDLNILKDAISDEVTYIDIELFFIESDIPYYGTDYCYEIVNNKLILKLKDKKKYEPKEDVNEDWVLDNYLNEYLKLKEEFIKSKYNYMIIYYDEGIKYMYLNEEPSKNIFIDLFYDKGYKAISLYKKSDDKSNLIYINSYSEL